MIRKRRLARERRMLKLADIKEDINDLQLEAELETGAARLAGKEVESVYASHMEEWSALRDVLTLLLLIFSHHFLQWNHFYNRKR